MVEVEEVELEMLLEAFNRVHGYDFRLYERPSLRRRVKKAMTNEGVRTISELQSLVLHDTSAAARFVDTVCVTVTEMFRDPSFYRVFRRDVVPILRTYPFIRIWHAGCSTGQEVYSMAILLSEAGLIERTRQYATDISARALDIAREGIFPLSAMRTYTANYLAAGGSTDFSRYYTARYDHVRFSKNLSHNVVFSVHSLANDESFNEFHVIICRNVLIYFSRPLQTRVFELFDRSLVHLGILALGSKETIGSHPNAGAYGTISEGERVYRRTQ